MYHHNLKIQERFVKPIIENEKRFEIRNNDRCFQKGDLVSFTVVDNNNIDKDTLHHKYCEFERMDFEITYIISGWGLKNGYVVFGFKERGSNDERTN